MRIGMCLLPPTKLEPRQVRAETEMLPEAECNMRIRIAADVELERLRENFFIAVRRRIKQAHRFAGFDLLAANHGIFARGPRELNNRCRPAQDLFDGRVDQPRIALELLPLVRMLDECL